MSATNDIFISYRRKNVEFVKRIVTGLEARNKSVWIDWEDIPPGAPSYSREIEEGIDGAHIFLAVLSPDYLESPHCLAELKHAADVNKRIVPIIYEKFEDQPVPEAIKAINWIYFVPHAGQPNPFESAFTNLMQAIEADYGHIQQHTRLLQRANDWNAANRDGGFLLRGTALHEAEDWLAQAALKQPPPSSLHNTYILASRRAQARRQRSLLAGTATLLAIALVALGVAVWQFFEASRRADETLSLLIANDAQSAAAAGDAVTAISRAVYASTFLSDPPQAVQAALQNVGLQPAPRYVIEAPELLSDVYTLPADAGLRLPIDDTRYLLQDSDEEMTIRSTADDTVQIRFDRFRTESRDNETIHPDVRRAIQEVQDNSFGYVEVGYDLSPDGMYVLMGREGRGLISWRNEAGAPEDRTFATHTLLVDNVQFTADGRYAITSASELQNRNFGRSEREIFIWEWRAPELRVVGRVTGFDTRSELAAISEDGRYLLLYTYSSGEIIIWDTRNGAALWQKETFEYVQDLTFSADNQSLIASTVFTLRMAPPDNITTYDLATGEAVYEITGLDRDHIIGMPLLAGSTDGVLRAISTSGAVSEFHFDGGETTAENGSIDLSYAVGNSANGRYVIGEEYEPPQLVVFDLETTTEIGRIPIGTVYNATISDDGRTLAYGLVDTNQLVVVDVASSAEIARFDNVAANFEKDFLFGGDAYLFYADRESAIHVVNTETWQVEQRLTGFLDAVNDMTYSAATQLLAAGGTNGAIRVWDINSGEIVFTLDQAGNRTRVALSADGSRLATGNEGGQIALWRLFNPEEVLPWVQGNRAVRDLSCADRLRYNLAACS